MVGLSEAASASSLAKTKGSGYIGRNDISQKTGEAASVAPSHRTAGAAHTAVGHSQSTLLPCTLGHRAGGDTDDPPGTSHPWSLGLDCCRDICRTISYCRVVPWSGEREYHTAQALAPSQGNASGSHDTGLDAYATSTCGAARGRSSV